MRRVTAKPPKMLMLARTIATNARIDTARPCCPNCRSAPTTTTPGTTTGTGTYYANCHDAYAAGAAPILRGEPGYRSGLDSDNDGIACENRA